MAPIQPLTCLDCYVCRFVGVGERVFDHCFGADQQPYCILGKSRPPADWKTFRNRWDLLHRWRVVLLTIAFAFLIVGGVSR
jgi:hypothetical protein